MDLKFWGIIFVIIVAVLLVFFSLNKSNNNESVYTDYDGDKNVYLIVETDKDQYQLGEDIEIKVTLVNNGSENYKFDFNSAGYDRVTITAENDTQVYSSLTFRMDKTVYLNLEANSEIVVSDFKWDQITMLATGDAIEPGSDLPVEAGNFTVSAYLMGYKSVEGAKVISIVL